MNVIFDLGNVILKWAPDHIVSSVDIPQAQQLELKRQLFEHQDWLDLDCGLVTEPEIVAKVCSRTSLSPAVLHHALWVAKESLMPLPGSLELLRDVHNAGLPTYCLSNMSVETYQHLRQKLDFFECFKGIVISGMEKHIKPEAAIFELILERYQLKPAETFFIDDSAANVAMARELGIAAHLFKGSDVCYSRIRELLL